MDIVFAKTDTVCNSSGVCWAPRPEGRAGFVRIDSVHHGDEDGMKEAYHITCLDSIAQWQVESCVEGPKMLIPQSACLGIDRNSNVR